MTIEIPVVKMDELQKISAIQGIPVEQLVKYYTKLINEPALQTAFDNDEDRFYYCDSILTGMISEFHNVKMQEYEIVVLSSSAPRLTKTGKQMNNHILMVKIGNDAPKVMNVTNYEDRAIRLPFLATGTLSVNVKSKAEAPVIEAQSEGTTEFVAKDLTWIPTAPKERLDWFKKTIRQITIATAGQNLSTKNDKKWTNPYSLRWIRGTIINRIVKDATETREAQGILSLTDPSANSIPDFGKTKQIPDPKDANKTITKYGGFTVFVAAEDVATIGKGSECIFIGTVGDANSMNAGILVPLMIKPYEKPTDKLHIPGKDKPKPAIVTDAMSGAVSVTYL